MSERVTEFEAALKEYGVQCQAWERNENADAQKLYAAYQRLVELYRIACRTTAVSLGPLFTGELD